MANISIEVCQKNDYKQYGEAYFKSYTSGNFLRQVRLEGIIKRFEEEFQKDLSIFYSAKDEGEIIGIGSLTHYCGVSFISNLGVIPAKQKQGIGKKLFERMLDDALEMNPTVDIFARGFAADKILKKNGFKEQYTSDLVELDLMDFNEVDYYKIDFNISRSYTIPQWVYKFDTKAIGYDRSKLLDHLMDEEQNTLFYYKNRGDKCYAIKQGNRIGPLIATSEKIAFHMITYLILHSANNLIVPEKYIPKLQYKFGSVSTKNQTCMKMTYGKKRKSKAKWIWSFNSFSFG